MNKFIANKFLRTFFYLIFLAGLFEGGARLAFSTPFIFEMIKDNRVESRWRQHWIGKHLQGQGPVTYMGTFDPGRGWKLKPDIQDMKAFEGKFLNVNSKSLRGKREFSYGKNPDKKRLLVLGDSFTFGHEVSDNETFSYFLQEKMPGFEVINMGVFGYGHDQMLITLKEEGLKFKPDIVLLGFVFLDMERNLLGFTGYAKPQFVIDNGNLQLTGVPAPPPEQILKWDWARPRILDLMSLLIIKIKVKTGEYDRMKKEVTARILDEMILTINSAGAVPVFVYLPVGYEINGEDKPGFEEEFFLSWCGRNPKVHCLNARPLFAEKVRQGAKFKIIGHWGPPAHQTAAELIYDFMVGEIN